MAYKAIVLLDLAGGNDSHNVIIPSGPGASGPDSYAEYAAARGSMAKSSGALVALPAGFGNYKLHPNLPYLGAIAAANRLAVVANVGTLVQPTTRAQYLNPPGGHQFPPQLFSHSDQQRLWASPAANSASNAVGWGAQIATQVQGANGANSGLTCVSFSGGGKVVEGSFASTASGPSGLYGSWSGLHDDLTDILALAPTPGNGYEVPLRDKITSARTLSTTLRSFWPDDPNWMPNQSAQNPAGFPTSTIGQAMRGIARMISLRGGTALNMDKQVLHARMGGFDTHNDNGTHDLLMLDLDQTLRAFDAAVQTMGADVVVYVYSEFGRTLRTNGNGSDHAWGGHAFMIGSSVLTGIKGTMPRLLRDGPDDIGLGRLVPTLAHEQPAAQLATWMGLNAGQVAAIFPNLAAFPAMPAIL